MIPAITIPAKNLITTIDAPDCTVVGYSHKTGASSGEQRYPQGGVVSPLLANLFLHYTFDKWMSRQYSHIPLERYADDGVAHCRSLKQAEMLKTALQTRFAQCGLELHPLKTRIIYCKDDDRSANYPETTFDFLERLNDRSGMNREIHVPLRESLKVGFLWATRPYNIYSPRQEFIPALCRQLMQEKRSKKPFLTLQKK